MKNIKKIGGGLTFLAVFAVSLIMQTHPASAIIVRSATGGDGYTPIIYKVTNGETRIFTIYHHTKPSGTLTPNNNINCVIATTSSICPGYPKYFSSVAGTSNSGIDDIATSFYPHYATVGSKVYYAAQRTSDNGIGCFDLQAATNCGYTALGSLATSADTSRPASTDGLEQVGNKLYTFGKDIKAYCFNLTTQLACVGQPFNVAPGDATMPAYDRNDLRIPRKVIGTNIYLAVNYLTQSTPADARLTCYDTLTDARCASWSGGVDLAGSSSTHGGTSEGISSIFGSYNTAGVATGVCAAGYGSDGVTCWNLTTGTSATAPAGLMVGLPVSLAREETRLGNKSYYAFYQVGAGFAECYDFTTQALCAGFGSPHTWPGVNGGNTRDYGYTYSDAGCFFATGDAAVLWSFDPITGSTGDTSCPGTTVTAAAVLPTALPDTGMKPKGSLPYYWTLAALPVLIAGLGLRRRYYSSNNTKI